jgi:hypothetical protein
VQVLYRLDGKQSSTSFKTWLQPTSSRSWSRNSGRQKRRLQLVQMPSGVAGQR